MTFCRLTYRLYPTIQQRELLEKHFGCCRFVYNYCLNKNIESYKTSKKILTRYDNSNLLPCLKQEYPWLNEVGAQALQMASHNVTEAYEGFFNRLRKKIKGNKGFPKFKTKRSKQSFKLPQSIKIKNRKLIIIKFKEGIKCNIPKNFSFKIRHCVVFKNKINQYFATFCVEKDLKKLSVNNNSIGIDCNINNVVCSNGMKFDNPLPEKIFAKRLRLLKKSVSRKKKGSKNREKSQLKLNRLFQYCKNVREDFLHKTSRQIINENQVIIVEDLSVQEMLRKNSKKSSSLNLINRKVRKLMQDAALSSFIFKLTYKSLWYDRELIKVDRYFPSSKLCSNCGIKNENLTDQKKWICEHCHTKHDRDENAALNILNEGLRIRNQTAGMAGLAYCPDVRLASVSC